MEKERSTKQRTITAEKGKTEGNEKEQTQMRGNPEKKLFINSCIGRSFIILTRFSNERNLGTWPPSPTKLQRTFSHVAFFHHSQFHPLPANAPPQLTSLAACILSIRGMAPLRRGAGLRAKPLPGGANRSALPRWAPRSGEPSLSCSVSCSCAYRGF